MIMDFQDISDFWTLVKEVWQEGAFGLDVSQIIIAFAILAIAYLFRGLFARVIISRLEALARRTTTTLDDLIFSAVEAPLRFAPLVLGVFLATASLDLEGDVAQFASQVNRSLIAFTIFWTLYRISGPVGLLLNEASHLLTDAMIGWLAKALKISFAVIGAAAILEIWGIRVGPLVAGLGLFGVAVALGAQNLFKNLIAGLFLLGEKRFLPGDWILVDGVVEGTVEDIGFRTTKVRRFDKAPVYVPNSDLADTAVVNFARMTYRRINWKVGVRYDTRSDQLEKIRARIEDFVTTDEDFVRPEDTSTFIRLDSFGASSIDILIYCFTRSTIWGEWLRTKERLLLEIKRIVEEEGSDFAYPSQSLYIETWPENRLETTAIAQSADKPSKGDSA